MVGYSRKGGTGRRGRRAALGSDDVHSLILCVHLNVETPGSCSEVEQRSDPALTLLKQSVQPGTPWSQHRY